MPLVHRRSARLHVTIVPLTGFAARPGRPASQPAFGDHRSPAATHRPPAYVPAPPGYAAHRPAQRHDPAPNSVARNEARRRPAADLHWRQSIDCRCCRWVSKRAAALALTSGQPGPVPRPPAHERGGARIGRPASASWHPGVTPPVPVRAGDACSGARQVQRGARLAPRVRGRRRRRADRPLISRCRVPDCAALPPDAGCCHERRTVNTGSRSGETRQAPVTPPPERHAGAGHRHDAWTAGRVKASLLSARLPLRSNWPMCPPLRASPRWQMANQLARVREVATQRRPLTGADAPDRAPPRFPGEARVLADTATARR